MTIQLDIHSFVRELKIVLTDKGGENLQVCFPTKSGVKKKKAMGVRTMKRTLGDFK
jgi:hypothetical protein